MELINLQKQLKLLVIYNQRKIQIKKKRNQKVKKDKKEKKNVDKSQVILEIKGWEADQDLEALGKTIINTMKKDGLN